MRYLFLIFLVFALIMGCTDSNGSLDAIEVNVMENYRPDHTITFPHSVHSGELGIDCKYCHSNVKDAETASIPSVNICINCHNKVNDISDLDSLYKKDKTTNIPWKR